MIPHCKIYSRSTLKKCKTNIHTLNETNQLFTDCKNRNHDPSEKENKFWIYKANYIHCPAFHQKSLKVQRNRKMVSAANDFKVAVINAFKEKMYLYSNE